MDIYFVMNIVLGVWIAGYVATMVTFIEESIYRKEYSFFILFVFITGFLLWPRMALTYLAYRIAHHQQVPPIEMCEMTPEMLQKLQESLQQKSDKS